ncbi:MAG: hypothetical protein WAV41_03645 [Microgenomates group bacterium]
MALMGLMALNPGALINRAQDSQRKKDLARIKVAFEEYFNDRECFPDQTMIDSLTCRGNGFAPWLPNWPCDPKGGAYKIYTGASCPKTYILLTDLLYKKDAHIPIGWYDQGSNYHFGDGSLTSNDVNYGVSSSNINWYDEVLPDPVSCNTVFGDCYDVYSDGCQSLSRDADHLNAYVDNNCKAGCQVSCCNNGRICN